MRAAILLIIAVAFAFAFSRCGSSGEKPKAFCDTACLKDTLKYTSDHKLKPYVYITPKNCLADSVIWSYKGMGINRKISLPDFMNKKLYLNKDRIRAFINDTSYVWLLFNDCTTGQGYSLKLPFNKSSNIGPRNSSINSLDPKYKVDDSLVAYTDRGNIFVEHMRTGKQATMTFGKQTAMEYNAMHETLDSVNITADRVWARVKIDNKWEELEKKITLK